MAALGSKGVDNRLDIFTQNIHGGMVAARQGNVSGGTTGGGAAAVDDRLDLVAVYMQGSQFTINVGAGNYGGGAYVFSST